MVVEAALAPGQPLHHGAGVRLGDLGDHVLHRLAALPVDLARDDLRARHAELVALAAHRLDQDADLELAAPRDLEDVRRRGALAADADVRERLAAQPVVDLAAGDEAALLAREGRGVRREADAQRGRIDLDPRAAPRGDPGRRACRRSRSVRARRGSRCRPPRRSRDPRGRARACRTAWSRGTTPGGRSRAAARRSGCGGSCRGRCARSPGGRRSRPSRGCRPGAGGAPRGRRTAPARARGWCRGAGRRSRRGASGSRTAVPSTAEQ